ncbi:hypothetical protein HS088_TW07G01154 [Tripterygium wilfordii]|uniref:Uncharacterized protein n=1 Tax=Tripterygium wilfordii TaxID=458696 RepID=A0A7J7DGT8_TRIWF|nr:hypothetical protein HS088_TW07G01154 [Tripterygium wilfordii]
MLTSSSTRSNLYKAGYMESSDLLKSYINIKKKGYNFRLFQGISGPHWRRDGIKSWNSFETHSRSPLFVPPSEWSPPPLCPRPALSSLSSSTTLPHRAKQDIFASSSPSVPVIHLISYFGESQPDLGYLLEATNDELGLLRPTAKEEAMGLQVLPKMEYLLVIVATLWGWATKGLK